MTAASGGDESCLQVAVMGEAGRQSGRFADNGPGRRAAGFEEGRATVAVFLLPDYQQQTHGWPLYRLQGVGKGEPSFDHGGAPAFHIRGSQTADDVAFLFRSKRLQVPGWDRIYMADQVELWLPSAHGHAQVIAFLFHFLTFHGESRPAEERFQVELNVLFLAGRRIDSEQIEERFPQPVRLDGLLDFLPAVGHDLCLPCGFFFLRVKLRVMYMCSWISSNPCFSKKRIAARLSADVSIMIIRTPCSFMRRLISLNNPLPTPLAGYPCTPPARPGS